MTALPTFAESRDARLSIVSLAGSDAAPPVVVINGGPGQSHHSVRGLGLLAAVGVHVVTYDQRGLGRSTGPVGAEGYALALQVEDVDAVRVALGRARITLVGHSYGGLLAMAYATAHPDRVSALVLVSPAAPDWSGTQAAGARFNARVTALAGAGKITLPPPAPVGDDCSGATATFLPALFADPDLAGRGAVADILGTRCSVRVQTATFGGLTGYDLRPALGTLRLPVLVVVGEGDALGTAPARAIVAALERAPVRLVELRRCGHFPWVEDRAAFEAAVLPFLRERSATPD